MIETTKTFTNKQVNSMAEHAAKIERAGNFVDAAAAWGQVCGAAFTVNANRENMIYWKNRMSHCRQAVENKWGGYVS